MSRPDPPAPTSPAPTAGRDWRVLLTSRWAGLTALAVLVAAACVLLGRWQLSRFEYRTHYNQLVTRNSTSAPVEVGALLAGLPPGHDITSGKEFRRVVARGHYLPGSQLLVRQRTYGDTGSQGFEVLDALQTDRGAVLVDRGWVPAGGDPLASPTVPAPPSGQVEVQGLLRDSERAAPDAFAQLPAGQVRRIDTAAVARRLGRPLLPGYVQLQSQQPPLDPALQALPASVNHQNAALNLAYTVQWWVFAAVALGALALFARREVREGSAGTDSAPPAAPAPPAPPAAPVAPVETEARRRGADGADRVGAAGGGARPSRRPQAGEPVATAPPRLRRSELKQARSRRGREQQREDWLARDLPERTPEANAQGQSPEALDGASEDDSPRQG